MKLKLIKDYKYSREFYRANFSDGTGFLYTKAQLNRFQLILNRKLVNKIKAKLKRNEVRIKPEDWDNQIVCMSEAKRLGYTERMGYHAWVSGQVANGYVSVLDFFEDIEDLVRSVSK